MKRFKLWESDITFTICLGTSTSHSTSQINADSKVVENTIVALGISVFLVPLAVKKSCRAAIACVKEEQDCIMSYASWPCMWSTTAPLIPAVWDRSTLRFPH